MKITKLELFKVAPRWVFLKLSTDEGLSGWGEPTLESRLDSVIAAVKELERYLIGQDPLQIEKLYQTLYQCGFYRGGPLMMSAIAGIDQALWDIKGKFHGVPIHQLLGGRVRDKIKVYSWIGGDNPSEAAAHAQLRYDQNYRAVKMNATGPCPLIGAYPEIDAAVQRVQEIRDKLGYSIDIALDFHGRVNKSMAKILVKELDPLRPLYYEEAVLSENHEALAELSRHTATPLATGERMYSRFDFKKLCVQGAIDIIQPDLSHAGGITETKKIATMAEAFGMSVAPHCPLGPIATAACLQLDANLTNFAIQELSHGIHYNQGADLNDYILNKDVFIIQDGYANIPEGPGLGLEMDEDRIRDAAQRSADIHGHPPAWTYQDGSTAEW